MEVVLRGASRLLGDCKVGNIGRKIWKIKQEGSSELKAQNTTLKLKINDLQVTMQAQDAEVCRLRTKTEGLDRIRAFIGNSGDIVAKAHLFNNEVKKEEHLSQQKIVTILVKFGGRIETALEEMRKLLAGKEEAQPRPPPAPLAASSSPRKKTQQVLDDLRERLQEQKSQEPATVVLSESTSATVLGAKPTESAQQ